MSVLFASSVFVTSGSHIPHFRRAIAPPSCGTFDQDPSLLFAQIVVRTLTLLFAALDLQWFYCRQAAAGSLGF